MELWPPTVKTGGGPPEGVRTCPLRSGQVVKEGKALMLNQVMLWPALVASWLRGKFSGKDDNGASLVEYALLLALIAVVAIGALVFLGNTVNNTIHQVGHTINSTNNANTP